MRIDIPGKGQIRFEGEMLSDAAKFFEVVPGYQSFPPNVCQWILDLRYAWGRVRQSDSELILEACDLLETATYTNRVALLEKFQKGFPQMSSSELLQDWLQTIARIQKIAGTRVTCAWTIEPVEGEIEYFTKFCLRFVRSLEATHRKKVLPEEFLRNIEIASRDEQLKFINLVVDSYSDRL